MKKSFEESIQWMQEQNWIKKWLELKGATSIRDAHIQLSLRRSYDNMSVNNTNCSIVWGSNHSFRDYYPEAYVKAIRSDMHKWMFNIGG